jgi:hypothetical protein
VKHDGALHIVQQRIPPLDFLNGGDPTVDPPNLVWSRDTGYIRHPIITERPISIFQTQQITVATLFQPGPAALSVGCLFFGNSQCVLTSIPSSHSLLPFVFDTPYETIKRSGSSQRRQLMEGGSSTLVRPTWWSSRRQVGAATRAVMAVTVLVALVMAANNIRKQGRACCCPRTVVGRPRASTVTRDIPTLAPGCYVGDKQQQQQKQQQQHPGGGGGGRHPAPHPKAGAHPHGR